MHPSYKKKPTVLEEIHATRKKLLDEAGGIGGLAKYIRQKEDSNSDRLATPIKPTEHLGRLRKI
jgi:hypothetical protein